MTIKELVKDNFVYFDSYRQEQFYYNLIVKRENDVEEIAMYRFPVPIEDIGNATMLAEDKAITFMRWIRQAQEEKTLIQLNK